MKLHYLLLAATAITVTSCRKEGCTDEKANNYNSEAKKDDGSCTYDDPAPTLNVPSTYNFKDADGNSTVSYSGQTDRLNQLGEMTTYMKSGTGAEIDAAVLKDMFSNEGDNGGGHFSFSSSKQLKNKCFSSDVDTFEGWMDALATASADFANTASDGNAGVLTTGEKTYLVAANGMEYTQLIEKGLMGAVFLNQAHNVYFEDGKMDVDNTTPVSPADGKYYTEMEHHWDEAFGYFGAPIDFLTNTSDLVFWAKYCNKQDSNLGGANAKIMNAFLKGRAAVSAGDLNVRDAQIDIVRKEWERVSARQAVKYMEDAKAAFGSDNAVFMHTLSEAYAFILSLKYVALDTRVISFDTIEDILTNDLGTNFWAVTLADINSAIDKLNSTYSF